MMSKVLIYKTCIKKEKLVNYLFKKLLFTQVILIQNIRVKDIINKVLKMITKSKN
jgi:hypothetical protein